MSQIQPINYFYQDFIRIQPHQSIYVLSIATLCYKGRIENTYKRDSCACKANYLDLYRKSADLCYKLMQNFHFTEEEIENQQVSTTSSYLDCK